MNSDLQGEVWEMLDRDHLMEVARKGPEPIFATISGAHLYGFGSPDSDVDLRGAFMLPARKMLGLHAPDETITIEDKTTIDLDWVAHDIRKFARLMTNHNGYVLEQLYSPLVVVTTAAHEELMQLGKGCVTRPTVRHYQGFARGRRKRLAEPDPTVKHLLYAYRVLLTGIHLMQTGEVIANIQVLNQRFRSSEIDELVARKRAGAEKMALEERDHVQHGELLDRLEKQLHEAYDASHLRKSPPRCQHSNGSWSSFVSLPPARRANVRARAAHHLSHPGRQSGTRDCARGLRRRCAWCLHRTASLEAIALPLVRAVRRHPALGARKNCHSSHSGASDCSARAQHQDGVRHFSTSPSS